MRLAILATLALVLMASETNAQSADQSPPQTQTAVAQPGQSRVDFTSKKCPGPINVASDTFEGDFQTKVGTYLGNVIITQSDCKLRADKVIAQAVSGNDLNRLTATGNVVFNSSSGTATGDNGVYDIPSKTITLTGKVVLTKGKDVMRGTYLVVDIDTGLAHLTAKGMPGGRVQSSFIPKQQGDSKSKPKKDN